MNGFVLGVTLVVICLLGLWWLNNRVSNWVFSLHDKDQEPIQNLERQRHEQVHRKFRQEFVNRQNAIGKIVCPQCKWTGNWGDGMSYQEFFAYELVKYEVGIDEMLIRDANNLSNEAQYKCPMCKSTNWQKV